LKIRGNINKYLLISLITNVTAMQLKIEGSKKRNERGNKYDGEIRINQEIKLIII